MHRSQEAEPRRAASVILLRESAAGVEVCLVRRHSKASFMSSAYVFPGGIANLGERDLRITACRELFEEAGVLLSRSQTNEKQRAAWRKAINVKEANFATTTASAPADLEALTYYSQWITPSVEKRRYSAKFYLATLPKGQACSADEKETVQQIWVTPQTALARAAELCLPPPQLRTFYELATPAQEGINAIITFAKAREPHAHAILPRKYDSEKPLTLLLPWDRDYESAGTGASLPMPTGHPLATGPSRFVLGPAGDWIYE